jgi:hypothetical protein
LSTTKCLFPDFTTRAPYPVWAGSTAAPIAFHPIPRKTAFEIADDVGELALLRAFPVTRYWVLKAAQSFANHKSGRCDPGRAAIAERAGTMMGAPISLRTVDRSLVDLCDKVGALHRVRRCDTDPDTGQRRQLSNAYGFVPSTSWKPGWRDRLKRRKPPPPPDPASTGAHPPRPCVVTEAKQSRERGEGAAVQVAILASDPRDRIAQLQLMVRATAARRAALKDTTTNIV